MPAGAWAANFGATRQALAAVAANSGRYFGLSRKERSPRLALSSGPDILDEVTEIGAVGRLGTGGLDDSSQGEGPGPLEETWMFHQILSGERRDIGHDAKP